MHTCKNVAEYIVVLIGSVLVICTFASLLYNTSLWYFQVLNFPRYQAFIIIFICLILY